MPDYAINQLGDRAFEQLIVSLCFKVLGPGIQAFGDGPDGGREATFEGPINWSATATKSTGRWDGYTVVQAKYHYHQLEPYKNTAWLKGQIDDELDRWVEAKKKGSRKRMPQYLIIASNVRLSPKGVTGGIDVLESYVRSRIKNQDDPVGKLKILDFRIWHRDQIAVFLDNAESVRYAFPGLLTVGDVLSRLGDHTSGNSLPELGPAMRQHASMCLRNEHWIRFSEAGARGSGQKATLEEVGTDLPAVFIDDDRSHPQAVNVLAHVIAHADAVLRRNLKDRVERPHWVIIGGPGQGKTTLSALLAQIYRAELLARGPMTPEVEDIVNATRNAMVRSHIPQPRNLRWPMRVDLTSYAETLMASPDTSILWFLAQSIGKRSDQPITAGQLHSWLRAWPWLVILDGLDEVSEAATRQVLMERVTDFMQTADEQSADLMLVSTTRPLGYDERFDPGLFTELALQKLTPEQSHVFGRSLVAARLKDDLDLQTQVLQRLRDAVDDPNTTRLMETPLQVTIMSFIVESYGTLPIDRYGLFSVYFQTVYLREIDKRSPVSRILNEYRADIEYLHYRVALELHVEAEGVNVECTMPLARLESIVRARLAQHGYQQRDIDVIAGKLVDAATHRLVLLVPNEGRVGFEIRSLQELMTALALSNGEDDRVLRLLEITAHHPHWRNVWLLAAGRIFKEREHLQKKLPDVVRRSDAVGGPLRQIIPTAPVLACNILDDGFASRAPNTRRAYIQLALSRLDMYPSYHDRDMASSLAQACADPEDWNYLFSELVKGAKSGGLRQINALMLLNALKGVRRTRLKAQQTLSSLALPAEVFQPIKEWYAGTSSRRRPYQSIDTGRRMTVLDVLMRELERHEHFGLDPQRVDSIAHSLRSFSKVPVYVDEEFDGAVSVDRRRPLRLSDLLPILDDPDIEAALALTLDSLDVELWAVATTVQEVLRPLIARRHVGVEVLEEVSL